MANRYNVCNELIYGAFLTTIVAVAPNYIMEFRLGMDACRPDCLLSFAFPEIGIYMFGGMLVYSYIADAFAGMS